MRLLLDKFNCAENLELWLFGIFLMSLFIAFRVFPLIIYIAIKKNLFDEPDERSSHSLKVPTLGGIGIFISLIFVICLSGVFLDAKVLIILVGGLTLLFFLGLKDDLFMLSPSKKLLGQFLAAFLLVVFTDIRIMGFSDILGLTTLPYWVSVSLTVFVFVLIINAYNLIDGINGLAGAIALIASLVFGTIFYLTDNLIPATLSFALAGSLIAFLRLNIRSKIFMGDTGSMIVGFMLAYFAISFISDVQSNSLVDYENSAPVIVCAILFYPLLDTFRIFFIRIFIYKTSPFRADKNHIHHRLLQLGFSHVKASLIISVISLSIIVLTLWLKDININLQVLCVSCFGIFIFLLPFTLKIKWTRSYLGMGSLNPTTNN